MAKDYVPPCPSRRYVVVPSPIGFDTRYFHVEGYLIRYDLKGRREWYKTVFPLHKGMGVAHTGDLRYSNFSAANDSRGWEKFEVGTVYEWDFELCFGGEIDKTPRELLDPYEEVMADAEARMDRVLSERPPLRTRFLMWLIAKLERWL